MREGRQHFTDAARHRPGLLGPAGLLPDAYEIDELALPNVIADDEAAIAGPLVHIAIVIILWQRARRRQRAPAHRSRVVRTFAAEHARAYRRADAVAADHHVGLGAGAVRECQAGRTVARFDLAPSFAKLDAGLRHRLREQTMQVAAMHDVVFGAVAFLEIARRQTIVNLAQNPNRARSIRPARMRLRAACRRGDGLKELDGIGTDVDAAPNSASSAALFVDLHFEALSAQRDGAASPPRPAPTMAMRSAFPISCSGDGRLIGMRVAVIPCGS